jgi:hypothetical protein
VDAMTHFVEMYGPMIRNRGQLLRDLLQGVALIIATAVCVTLPLELLQALTAWHYWP